MGGQVLHRRLEQAKTVRKLCSVRQIKVASGRLYLPLQHASSCFRQHTSTLARPSPSQSFHPAEPGLSLGFSHRLVEVQE